MEQIVGLMFKNINNKIIIVFFIVITVALWTNKINDDKKTILINNVLELSTWFNQTIEKDIDNKTQIISKKELPDLFLKKQYDDITTNTYKNIFYSPIKEINEFGFINEKLNSKDYVFYDSSSDYYVECYKIYNKTCYSNILYDEKNKNFIITLVIKKDSSFFIEDATDINGIMWVSSSGESSWNQKLSTV